MAPQAACVHEGGGVERRAAHHERERQRRQREAAGGSTEPAAEEATDVEAVSAADVLAGVEESGPNYALPIAHKTPETSILTKLRYWRYCLLPFAAYKRLLLIAKLQSRTGNQSLHESCGTFSPSCLECID